MILGRRGSGLLVGAALLAATGAQANAAEQGSKTSPQAETSKSASAKAKRSVSGQVKSIDSKALTLSNGEQLRLTSSTRFVQDGKTISRQDIKPGEQVRAAYEPRQHLAYATQVQVVGKSAK